MDDTGMTTNLDLESTDSMDVPADSGQTTELPTTGLYGLQAIMAEKNPYEKVRNPHEGDLAMISKIASMGNPNNPYSPWANIPAMFMLGKTAAAHGEFEADREKKIAEWTKTHKEELQGALAKAEETRKESERKQHILNIAKDIPHIGADTANKVLKQLGVTEFEFDPRKSDAENLRDTQMAITKMEIASREKIETSREASTLAGKQMDIDAGKYALRLSRLQGAGGLDSKTQAKLNELRGLVKKYDAQSDRPEEQTKTYDKIAELSGQIGIATPDLKKTGEKQPAKAESKKTLWSRDLVRMTEDELKQVKPVDADEEDRLTNELIRRAKGGRSTTPARGSRMSTTGGRAYVPNTGGKWAPGR